jgi:hypothetical protein
MSGQMDMCLVRSLALPLVLPLAPAPSRSMPAECTRSCVHERRNPTGGAAYRVPLVRLAGVSNDGLNPLTQNVPRGPPPNFVGSGGRMFWTCRRVFSVALAELFELAAVASLG